MRILFDHGAPKGVARALGTHTVHTVRQQGWHQLKNGDLLQAAGSALFEVLFTTDQQIRYQQNLTPRRIALVVLTGTSNWSRVRLHLDRIAQAVDAAGPGSYTEVQIPFE